MQDYMKAMIIQTVIVVISGTVAIIFIALSANYLSIYLVVLVFMWIAGIPIGVYFIFGKHVFFWHGNTAKEERLKIGLICFFPRLFLCCFVGSLVYGRRE
jgi:hypothetical protein